MPLTNWELRYATHNPIRTALLYRGLRRVSALLRSVVVSSAALEAALMAHFRVELVQSIIETAVMWLEANSEAEAEEMALELAKTGEPGAGIGASPVKVIADWKFKDVIGDIEVLSVQQIREMK